MLVLFVEVIVFFVLVIVCEFIYCFDILVGMLESVLFVFLVMIGLLVGWLSYLLLIFMCVVCGIISVFEVL